MNPCSLIWRVSHDKDIDEETAENIIELRELIGGFTNVYELLYAVGMTENKLAGILDYVQVVETDEQPVQ